MKNNILAPIGIIVTAMILASCANLGSMQKKMEELGASATPNPLELHGDSVAINMSGKFPEKYFAKKVVIDATPVLTYGSSEARYKTKTYQGEKAAGNGEVIPYKTGKSFNYSDKIAFRPGMEESQLNLSIFGRMGTKEKQFDLLPVAPGVITTPLLMKSDDKAMYAKDRFERVTTKTTEAIVNFDYNSSVVRPQEMKDADIVALENWFREIQANPKIVVKNIEFQAYASPEGEIFLNENLAKDRAEAGKKVFNELMKRAKITSNYDAAFFMNPKGEDWEGFRQMMEKSNITDRDIIIRILQKTTDLAQREEEIKNISKTYLEIQKDIFPPLRRCIIRVTYDIEGYSDAELRTIATSNPANLNYEELMKSGTLTEDLTQQASIYQAAAAKEGADFRATNNLGVVYYQQNRIGDATTQFDKAYGMMKSPETSNNKGITTRLNGDRKAASALFNESGTNEAKYNRGLVQIANGDYGSAVSGMSNYQTFNSALAKLLNKDNAGAKKDIDASNDNSAMADYLRAVIAARSNDSAGVASNLKSAVQKDGSLGAKAKKDLEFRNFQSALTF
jgi:tetratricopeptide (TPR) repeat protein